jgi:hypothetical protein
MWTWRRGDGSEYVASAIPALWLRIADRKWPALSSDKPYRDMLRDYGPLADEDDLVRPDWKTLHHWLKGAARLWHPSADDPAIHCLNTFALPRDANARALRVSLDTAGMDGDLVPRLNEWRLEVMPLSLRGFLLMTSVADIAARQRFRRCDQCHEWFPVARTDARFCSNVCRQAAHLASKGAA